MFDVENLVSFDGTVWPKKLSKRLLALLSLIPPEKAPVDSNTLSSRNIGMFRKPSCTCQVNTTTESTMLSQFQRGRIMPWATCSNSGEVVNRVDCVGKQCYSQSASIYMSFIHNNLLSHSSLLQDQGSIPAFAITTACPFASPPSNRSCGKQSLTQYRRRQFTRSICVLRTQPF